MSNDTPELTEGSIVLVVDPTTRRKALQTWSVEAIIPASGGRLSVILEKA